VLTENSCGLEPSTPVIRSRSEITLDSPGKKHQAVLLTYSAIQFLQNANN
jgi:hypothetical protein